MVDKLQMMIGKERGGNDERESEGEERFLEGAKENE